VALVAGATRGAGRAIAVELARAGAYVYATSRSTRSARSEYDRPETIEETGELMEAAGGQGFALRVDHLESGQVAGLAARINREQGRLDVLVNDIWGGENLVDWETPVWEHDLANGLRLLRLAVDTHLITSHHMLPLMIRNPGGLVIEVTDGTAEYNAANYRLSVFYDLAKASVIRLAWSQGHELAPHGCAAVALTPGWMRSEMMLEHYGVTEDTWRDALDRPYQPPFPHPVTSASRRPPPSPAARWSRSRPTRSGSAGIRARCPRAASPGSTASPTWTAAARTRGATWSRCRTRACRRTLTRIASAAARPRLRHRRAGRRCPRAA